MRACAMAQDAREMEAEGLGVDVTDPVGAAQACDLCRNAHCPALLDPKPTRGPRTIRVQPPFNPDSDSQQVKRDEGEGQE